MACNCSKRKKMKYVWTSTSGAEIVYDTEIQAKAAVLRKGGTYKPKAS